MTLRLMSTFVLSSSLLEAYKQSSEKLINQLLERVQECQKKYGGKRELATEFDNCVIALCLSLEAILSYGLRVKPCQKQTPLKQVSGIVNSFNTNIENPSFWPFIKEHLTKHEEERFGRLKHIWSDAGKGKAWLRSSLNEKSLERYLHILLSNPEVLKKYYEPWAILRNEEQNSMLPNMAAGLSSILFAICIDKPELNSGITRKADILESVSEPIIEAPLPEKIEKKHRRKKVSRQFISFGDDSSALSDSIAVEENKLLKDNSMTYLKNMEESKIKEDHNLVIGSDTNKPTRKLSIEISGVRDEFSANIPETLTPISQFDIGELTPVSVEINKDVDSLKISDNIAEAPADTIIGLTVVEAQNSQALMNKDLQIKDLKKKNNELKEQINKYVNAMRVLRTDDKNVQKILAELQIEEHVNKCGEETNIPENKFAQVAEMYAELMDFNVQLQQTLVKKDSMIEKLRKELENLRGPISPLSEDWLHNSQCVNVWIPSAFLTGTGSDAHHVYQIFLRAGSDEWNIYRRYAQFFALHSDLKKMDPVVGTFDFPPKKSIGNKGSGLVEDRRKRLQIYLRRVIVHWPELAHCNSRILLEQHLIFFKDDSGQSKKNMFNQRGPDTSSNNYSGL